MLRLTLTRAMAASLVLTGLLVGALVWLILAAWERSIVATAAQQQATAADRARSTVEAYLEHVRRVVDDIERRRAAGVCDLDSVGPACACLLGHVAADEALAEVTFTSADGWQASSYREANGKPCRSETTKEDAGFVAAERCGKAPPVDRPVPDPRLHPTYETPSQPEFANQLLWSDLSYSARDASRPESERRLVVQVLKQLRTTGENPKTLGVLRVALLERELDQAIAHMRVHDSDPNDPFRVFLADGDGHLITRWSPDDRLREKDDELRVAPDDVPPQVAQALELAADRSEDVMGETMVGPHGVHYSVSFIGLPGTQGWRAGVIGPSDYYLARPHRARRWIAIAAVGILALLGTILLLATAATRRALRRVLAESERMRRFEFDPAPSHSGFADVAAVLDDLERAKTALRGLSRYAPVDLVRRLYADKIEPKLGGELRTVTLMFTDIEGFTTFAETTPPERLALLLGAYFAAMTEAVTAHGGTVDKYIGDALMVMWNAPASQPDHALRACRAALACRRAGDALFASELWQGVPPLNTRFGIHTDDVMVGHFGAPERFAYTALGDGVNLASRLEGLNKAYGTTILVSGAVAEKVRGTLLLRHLDRVAVKGKLQGVDVYELLGEAEEARLACARRYEEALQAYLARDFAGAVALLAPQLDDPPSAVLHQRCQGLTAAPPPPDWRGVHAWTTK
jgi:adenylate cyclase